MQSFSTSPASSKQDEHDLSDVGFFYTGAVFYKQKPLYYKKKCFLENSANTNYFFIGEKHTICFHCGLVLKAWKVTDSAWREHAIWNPIYVYALHIQETQHSYHSLLLDQINVQRVWFGTAVPLSYTVIPGKNASVHIRSCSPQNKHILSVSLVVI